MAIVHAHVRFEGDVLRLEDIKWRDCIVSRQQSGHPGVEYDYIPLEEALRREQAERAARPSSPLP